MSCTNPIIHMDLDYMWRWYIINAAGNTKCMSTRSFFAYEDARRDFDATRRRFLH